MALLWLMGSEALALCGKVKDDRGAGIPGALVSLASDPTIYRTTGGNGEFRIDRPVSLKGRDAPAAGGPNCFALGVKGKCLKIALAARAPAGTLTVFAVDGKIRLQLPLRPMMAGIHFLDLPELAPGVYSLWISLGRHSASAHLIHSSGRYFLMKKKTGALAAGAGDGHAAGAGRDAEPVDTLLVEKPGYHTARSPIHSYGQSGLDIVMPRDPGALPTLPPIHKEASPAPFVIQAGKALAAAAMLGKGQGSTARRDSSEPGRTRAPGGSPVRGLLQ